LLDFKNGTRGAGGISRGDAEARKGGKEGERFNEIVDRIDGMNQMGSQMMAPQARDCPPSS